MSEKTRSEEETLPSGAPLARVALVRKRVALAAPVRIIEIEATPARSRRSRAAVAGGSVWVMRPEHAVEEIPLD